MNGVRLHPATAHGDRLHRWAATDPADRRIAWTFCGLRFAWGSVPRGEASLQRCERCWPAV